MATLQQIIDYSKANPNTAYAKNAAQLITTGQFDQQALKEGIDLSPYGRPAQKTSSQSSEPAPNTLAYGVNNLKKVGSVLTQNEQNFGQDIAAGIGGNMYADQISKANQQMSDSDLSYLKAVQGNLQKAQTSGDQASVDRYNKVLQNFHLTNGTSLTDLFPALKKTNGQVLGDAGGVLLDILAAGSYGNAAKGAETGQLLSKTAAPVVETATKEGLGSTLKTIGKQTLKNAAVGGATGYGYDVTSKLASGKTGSDAFTPGVGTLTGVAIPTVIGGVRAGLAIGKEEAPRFINSLIKPKQADFSYGKNPGRTVSELGITGNSIPDFANNINQAKQDIGQKIGSIYSSPENASKVVNTTDDIGKLDTAIQDAAKGGKNNQAIVTQLQNIKDAILYEHGIDGDGNIAKIGDTPRDLSSLNPQQAFDLKSMIADHTQFTGRPSDDKTVNSVLKDIYGGIKEKLNTAVGDTNPEITKLNQQYADLTSAEIATRNRNAIVQRSGLVNIKSGGAGAIGTVAALISGAAALPATLVGVGAASLEKAMETTAVKTRVASWLAKSAPSTIADVLEKNPAIRGVLLKALPKYASQLANQ